MIKVIDIMTKEVIITSPDTTIIKAAKLLTEKSVSSLVVVEKGKAVAVISEADITKGIIGKKTKVREVMDREFQIISPLAKFSEISKMLREKKIKRFPIVDKGRLVGLITETDIIETTRDFTRFHQMVQDIILAVFGIATAFFLFYFSPLRAWIFS
ncbi:MAG TPA: CBS domain-containing protein [Candidatus Nanoarchaeia archaeon]|nr:CBS domain-containing protein [Candidatus Nanoarchaeia archaeon]